MSRRVDTLARRLARLRALEERTQWALLAADERDLGLTEVVETLRRIWGSHAATFWSKPHWFLGGRSPHEAVHTGEAGIEQVRKLLGRIEHGLPV